MNIPKNRGRALLAFALSATLVSTVAIAQQAATSTPARSMHAKLDANGDGVIDKNEAAKSPRLAGEFDQLDRNRDGRLTADERPQRHRDGRRGMHGMHERMQKLDANGDKRVSRAEAAAKPEFAQRFDKLDANRDGFLDRGDWQARMAQKRGECFAKADADKNGQLSRGEFDAMPGLCHPRGGMRDGASHEG
jgi:Ca2+-binding EF-hand superfamily protein